MKLETVQPRDPAASEHASPVLAVRDVSHHFGDVDALRNVSLDVGAGEIVGLLGPNGAGKTTLVRVIATLVRPDTGKVTVCGADVAAAPAEARSQLGLAGQFASVDELLTGRENLELIGRLYGIANNDCRQRAEGLLGALGLDHAADRRVAAYSGGMRRRLDLGATLIGDPALLLLDEPTAGLDPRSRLAMWDLISDIARRGTGVLITSQDLDEIEQLADRVVVLDAGAPIADDTVDRLRRRIGGQMLDVGVPADQLDAATHVLHNLDTDIDTQTDRHRRRITTPTTGGLSSAVTAANSLLDAQVDPDHFALRSPSLEEAFLALTDDPAATVNDDTTLDTGPLPQRTRPAISRSMLRNIATLIVRDMKRLIRTPESLFFAAVMPIMFVLGLAAVFGNLVETVLGESYIQFLLPGVLVMQITLAAGATGVGLATDLTNGIIDRFRSLPMAQVAVLAGRTTADLARNTLAATIMIAAGFAIGYRLDGGIAGGLAALAIALLFGYATTWVFAAAGLAVKDPQAANFIGFAPVLFFVYLSSAWVPVDTMHGAVQGFARNQPVNVTIEAVRDLADGTASTSGVLAAIAWSAAILTVFAWLAQRQFRTGTA